MSEPRVAILVPRRAGIPDRDRLWDFARKWWEHDHPGWQLVEGHHEIGPFNRGAAINMAAASADPWDVAVIIDSDVLCDAEAVRDAVGMAASSNKMVLAYNERVQLSAKGTERLLGGFRGNWRNPEMVHKVLHDACSSAVVVSRDLYDSVHGYDERFVGWGWEDVAFRVCCETISQRPMTKIAATCWHLHHLTSHENNAREATFQANKARGERYKAAHFDLPAVLALINETDETAQFDRRFDQTPTRIPRILHRTVPEETTAQVEGWWEHFRQLHPGWQLVTHRDPMDPDTWPELGDLWAQCSNGAQRAGLIRLEALWRDGGVYVDSDVEPYRSFEPLLNNCGFAAWEDASVVPDAVLGAEPNHPAVQVMMMRARHEVEHGGDAWASGPGVTTRTLPGRADWLLLPPGSFYPYHYRERQRRNEDHMTQQPWAFCAHHWSGSWLSPEQRQAQTTPPPVRRPEQPLKMPSRRR